MCLMKVLMVYKFPLIAGMDDMFIGRFLFFTNVFSHTLVHTLRYFIGTFFESREFQSLSGIQVSYEEIYWNMFPQCSVVIFLGAKVSIMLKRTLEKYKEYKIQKRIHCMEVGQSDSSNERSK